MGIKSATLWFVSAALRLAFYEPTPSQRAQNLQILASTTRTTAQHRLETLKTTPNVLLNVKKKKKKDVLMPVVHLKIEEGVFSAAKHKSSSPSQAG